MTKKTKQEEKMPNKDYTPPRTRLGSFVHKPHHTFRPFKSFDSDLSWLVMSFKYPKKRSKRVPRETNVEVTYYAVIADSPENAVLEAIKSYEVNKDT